MGKENSQAITHYQLNNKGVIKTDLILPVTKVYKERLNPPSKASTKLVGDSNLRKKKGYWLLKTGH
jgi:hypothetical protein